MATSAATLPVANALSAWSRCGWLRPPWIGAADTPSWPSSLGQPVGAVAGAAEHHRRAELAHDVGGELRAVGRSTVQKTCCGSRHVRPGRADLVADRVALHRGGELADGAVERRREHQHLAVGVRLLEDAAHGRHEAHVGHAVGLVDDDLADVVEAQRRRIDDEVLEAAGQATTSSAPASSALRCGP